MSTSRAPSYDQLFKRAFRVPEHVAGELAAVLPPGVRDALDLGSLEAVPGDFVDERLRERFADAMFRGRFHGTLGYIYVLLEHQSQTDKWMPLRVLEQIVRVWREAVREEPGREKLPPMVCVVVHHGGAGGPARGRCTRWSRASRPPRGWARWSRTSSSCSMT